MQRASFVVAMRWLLALVLVTVVPACVTILPYERELLARPDMQFDANGAVMLAEEHGATTREGSAGAFGGGGGGCGCN